MKNMILFSVITMATSMALAKDCTHTVSNYYNDTVHAHVQKVTLELGNETRAIYSIRGNEQGGDFMDEAVVDAETCKILTTYNIWSE
jgi:hypothetical protein